MPEALARAALRAFARFNDALSVYLQRRKSQACSFLEFPGLAGRFWDDGGDVIARFALPREKIRRIVELAERLNARGKASLAALQKPAGALCFAQTAVMG